MPDGPVYRQIQDRIRQLIADGEFAIGDKFLSERQVAERFDISRPTANKVLSGLVADGRLIFRKGVGTFVAEPVLGYDLRHLVSFTDRARQLGKQPTTTVVHFAPTGDVDPAIREALHADGTEPCWYLERVRAADHEAVIHEARWIPLRRCPHLSHTDVQGSLYTAWGERHDLVIGGADQRIHAIACPADVAAHLGLQSGAPVFQVACTGFTDDGQPLWWERTTYRGDAYEFRSRLGNQDDGTPVQGGLRER